MPITIYKEMESKLTTQYQVPEVNIIEVIVENGFISSGSENSDNGGFGLPDWGFV